MTEETALSCITSGTPSGEPGERIGYGFEFTEGPVWLSADVADRNGLGSTPGLYFSDIDADTTYFAAAHGLRRVRRPSGRSNGNALDRSGRIISCEHDGRRISRRAAQANASGEGDGWETLVDSIGERRLNSPNDLCCRADGTVFFTDPPYGVDQAQREIDVQGVYASTDDGACVLVDASRTKPNGIAIDPGDDSVIWLADTETGEIVRHRISPDLEATPIETVGGFERPDGLAFDAAGNLLVAVVEGIMRLDVADGRMELVIEMDERPANMCFGAGSLFVCARTSVWRFDATPLLAGDTTIIATGDRAHAR